MQPKVTNATNTNIQMQSVSTIPNCKVPVLTLLNAPNINTPNATSINTKCRQPAQPVKVTLMAGELAAHGISEVVGERPVDLSGGPYAPPVAG